MLRSRWFCERTAFRTASHSGSGSVTFNNPFRFVLRMLEYILLIVGFALLVKGADWLVDGASSIARRLRVSELAIGLTLVAFGTSAPELLVNIVASSSGATDIAVGNILGSNIANILLILGIAALIYPLRVQKGTVWKEIPLSLLAAVLVGVVASDQFIEGESVSTLGRIDGIVFIAFFIIFLYYVYSIMRNGFEPQFMHPLTARYGLGRALLFIVGGLAGLIVGGKWVVDGAVAFATLFGVSQSLIGLTIVAVGTSLPELATSAVAAYKRNADIAVGNIVGSNIFNIFFILGVSSIIQPLPFSPGSAFDIFVTIFASALLFLWMFVGKRHLLERWQGVTFIVLYIVYVGFAVVRG